MGEGQLRYLVEGLHVVPDYYGNRSPFANARMRAVTVGYKVL